MKSCQRRKFNQPLILEKQVFSDDGGGGRLVDWAAVQTLWAEMTPTAAKEITQDGHLVMRTSWTIFIRPRQNIDATMRFRKGNTVFAITGLLLLPQGEGAFHQAVLKCLCESFDRT